MGANGKGLLDVTDTEDLHRPVGRPDQTRLREHLGRHIAVHAREIPHVDDLVLHPVQVREAALGNPADERHLAAFGARMDAATRARLLTLLAAAGRLTVAGARSAPLALRGLRRAPRRG